MDLEGIMLSEICQSEKKANTIWFYLYVESKETNNNETLIDTESSLVIHRGEGFGGLDERSEGIKKYKLIVTK